MQQSRRELLDDFLDFVGDSGDTVARNTAERLMNRAIMTIWRSHPWRQFVMPTPLTFTLVAGQRSYVLPEHFGRIAGGKVRNLTKGMALSGIEPLQLQEAHPEIGSTLENASTPEVFTIGGTSGVYVQTPYPEALTVVSTDALDGPTVRITVSGYDNNVIAAGRWARYTVALNGQIPVPIPSLIPLEFSKAYVQTTAPTNELTSSLGNVSLTGAGSGVLQVLGPYESAVEHQLITVFPMPAASGDVIAVPYLRRPVRSLYDADVIPMDWTEALFEEMVIQWRVNTGELTLDTANISQRPKLLDLLAFENANRFGVRASTRPFTG